MSQNHYDKRNEVNTDDLENYIFEGEKRRKDKYIALIFILLGICGLFYVVNSRQKDADQELKNPIYITTPPTSSVEEMPKESQQANRNKKQNQSSKKKKPLAKHLRIEGFMEANDPITFIIERFNKNATYVLRFSNGKEIEFQQKEIQYTFKNPGDYRVSLDVIYQDKRELIARRKFEIMQAIAVAPTANQIDFQ